MWIVPLFVAVFGAVLAAVGTGLVGSSWIAPEGLIGGGVALSCLPRRSSDRRSTHWSWRPPSCSSPCLRSVASSPSARQTWCSRSSWWALVIRAALEPWSPTSRSGVPGAGALFVTAVSSFLAERVDHDLGGRQFRLLVSARAVRHHETHGWRQLPRRGVLAGPPRGTDQRASRVSGLGLGLRPPWLSARSSARPG